MNSSTGQLQPPQFLAAEHVLSAFDCGVPSLDEWLKRRARASHSSGASRTYIVATEDGRVAGYYALAAGAIALRDAPGSVRRNMPDPIPMIVLGRLAVDRAWHGQGVGVALLQDAVLRSAAAASEIGVRGVLVHAISDAARDFYIHHGFAPAPDAPMTLVLSLKAA